ncbi:uncharacterized protein LOC121368448 [Gigantopelta aegis]|uniref:uncharacterized protein LOC121368448 n=1 Tax=Gigantopelta aegis TaxID=1735272 RepID=UPI001B88B291|nr:uncharacterized protein LOC121368448 [Gigantopelta aegis]XP_041349116.1 uncharacterized protein LOC121368448 [Gigantopelta aegis]
MELKQPTGSNKSDEQKLTPALKTDQEYMDEFFSGISVERPVTPGQDSDPVEASTAQRQVVLSKETADVNQGKTETQIQIDVDSRTNDEGSLKQNDSVVKEQSDDMTAETANNETIIVEETGLPAHPSVGFSVPDIIHDPLSSGQQTGEEPMRGTDNEGVASDEAPWGGAGDQNGNEPFRGAGGAGIESDEDPKKGGGEAVLQSDKEAKGGAGGVRIEIDKDVLRGAGDTGVQSDEEPIKGAGSAGEQSDEEAMRGADDQEHHSDEELMRGARDAELAEQDNDGKLGEVLDEEHHAAAINIVQELLNQALENSGGSGYGSNSDFFARSEHVETPVMNTNRATFDSESIPDRVGQVLDADLDGAIHKEIPQGEIMIGSPEDGLVGQHVSESHSVENDVQIEYMETKEENIDSEDFVTRQPVDGWRGSASDLAQDEMIEHVEIIEEELLDGGRQLTKSTHDDIYDEGNKLTPGLENSQSLDLEDHVKNYSKLPSPDLPSRSDDDDDDGYEKPICYGVKESSAGLQRFVEFGHSEVTTSKGVSSQNLDQQYSDPTVLDDHKPLGHVTENLTDSDWSENERKQYSHDPRVQKTGKQEEEFEPRLARQIPSPSPVSPSSEYVLKPPSIPTSRSRTDFYETDYIPSDKTKDIGRNYDTSEGNLSLGGSYLTHGHDRDELYTRSRPLLTSVHQSASWSPGVAVSPPSSGPVPGFKSLQDQQLSWLQMFKILEKQHRRELQSQYVEHQRLIEGIQVQMERDLQKQQESLHQRLEVHREMLNESSTSSLYNTGDRYCGYRLTAEDANISSIHPGEESIVISSSSMPVRRALDRDFDSRTPSPNRGFSSLDSGLRVSSKQSPRRSPRRSPRKSPVSEVRLDLTGEKMLRGGVYSTPMPISRGKSASRSYTLKSENRSHRRSPRASSPEVDELLHRDLTDTRVESRTDTLGSHRSLDYDSSYLSPSSKLREKHIKAMADLRSYYECEIQDLRDALTVASPVRETARERILQDENQEIKRRCDDLVEEIHATRIRNRELEQKIQGLEIRANDYADRYDDSQRTVLSLKNRLEELHSYAKDRDQTIEEMEIKMKEQAQSLKEAYNKIDQLTESSRRENTTLQKVLEKYEGLEKEYNIVKESARCKEEKLYEAKTEVVDLNKVLSKLELQIKQLNRENDNLRHKAAVAMNMTSITTSYEDSYGFATDHRRSFLGDNHDINRSAVTPSTERTPGRLNGNVSKPVEDILSDGDSNKSTTSPLIKAERELLKLQNKQRDLQSKYSPSSQKKFYGSEMSYSGKRATEYEYSKKIVQSPKYSVKQSSFVSTSPKQRSRGTGTPKQDHRESRNRSENSRLPRTPPRIQIQPKKYSSPTRFDVEVDNRPKHDRLKGLLSVPDGDGYPSQTSNSNSKSRSPNKSPGSMKTVADTLERVRAGDIVSRPQWEDIHTSMAKPRPSAELPFSSMTRDQRLEERIQTITKLEKKYEELHVEKRTLESQLTRIPSHGHLKQKEDLEDQYDKVERELGSVRMSLKRFQVIKSTI